MKGPLPDHKEGLRMISALLLLLGHLRPDIVQLFEQMVLMPKSLKAWSHFKGCSAFVKMSAAWRSVATYLITTPVPGSSCPASADKFTLRVRCMCRIFGE